MSGRADTTAERWTVGGARLTRDRKRVHAWIDDTGAELMVGARGSRTTGSVSTVQVLRQPDGAVTIYGEPEYTGDQDPEPDRRARLTAGSRATEARLQMIARERADKRADALNAAIEPLVEIARTLPSSPRAALVAIIVRRVGGAW